MEEVQRFETDADLENYHEEIVEGRLSILNKSDIRDYESELSPLKYSTGNIELNPDVFLAEGHGTIYLRRQTRHSASETQMPLYVIDGIPLDGTPRASTGTWGSPNYESPSDISQDEILSMEILSRDFAMEKYGEAGKNGAIEITTITGSNTGLSYIRSDDGKTYSRDDAAAYGFKNLLNQQSDDRYTNN